MIFDLCLGLFAPFFGTFAGAACVFFMKNSLGASLRRALNGFAAGVMVAASVWSLLLPAIERSATLGAFSFFPAVVGLFAGMFFILLTERLIARLQKEDEKKGGLDRVTALSLAVTLHNLPEGLAVGVALAGWLFGSLPYSAALALAVGIGIQNVPEGAIISMPLRAAGRPRGRAFLAGVLSGIVEPIAAALTLLASGAVAAMLPYLLAFAAGAMLFVVAEELIPSMKEGTDSAVGTVFFTVGFSLMMALDVALG